MTTSAPTPELAKLVARLSRRSPEEFELEDIREELARIEIPDDELQRHSLFLDDHHARCSLHRTPVFELLLLCWRPGQQTLIHDHCGQRGWVRVLRGQLLEQAYAPKGPIPRDEVTELDFEAQPAELLTAGPGVVHVDADRAFHRIENPLDRGAEAISLHLYSRPHATCTTWDPGTRRCQRRALFDDRSCSVVDEEDEDPAMKSASRR